MVLADSHTGMIADDLSDYLFARSTGHIGSLMTLINRGCQRAVRTGAEKLTTELLDRVKNDAAAEKARQELELAINTGNDQGRPQSELTAAPRLGKAPSWIQLFDRYPDASIPSTGKRWTPGWKRSATTCPAHGAISSTRSG